MKKSSINNLVIYNRVLEEANYIVDHNSTVRGTAKITDVSKSTVHKDLTERLESIDKDLYSKVEKVLSDNKEERHLRGGEATKQKYLKKDLKKI